MAEAASRRQAMQNAPEILHLPIDQVKPYPRHARLHNRKQRLKLQALLRRHGQVTPIIVDENYVIVDGHAVHAALLSLGQAEILAVVTHGREPAEVRALRLALNRIPEDAGWDDDRLRAELADLLQLGFNMELTGFDSVEIDMALAIDEPPTDRIEEAAVEELISPDQPGIVELGNVWQLGRHTVACGDARDHDLIQRLAGVRLISAVFTDPPYNVPIAGFVSGLGSIHHRDFAMATGEMNGEEFTRFLTEFLGALKPALADGAILYTCMDWRHMRELLDAGAHNKLELKNLCVWAKSNAGMGSFYRSQHELVFVWKHGSGSHQNHFELGQFGRSRSNVWEYRGVNTFGTERTELLGVHPTIKPVTMIADALRDVTRRGDLVLDPFLGSGSTLLAAEETGRCCIGVELDPGYVELAIRRWQKRTRKDAADIVSGETFDAFIERRRAERTRVDGGAHGDDRADNNSVTDEREGGSHG
jgi:DNA modification methylase